MYELNVFCVFQASDLTLHHRHRWEAVPAENWNPVMQVALRSFHTARSLWRPVAVEKSALAKLRKATGYSFTKCKEALQKHDNDLKQVWYGTLRRGFSFKGVNDLLLLYLVPVFYWPWQAEDWLKTEAQAHGWEKATKLRGRATAQGLVSILSSPNNTVMTEINCETDFVARNSKFQTLVEKITQGTFQFSNEQHSETLLLTVSQWVWL
jgi:elongation factor Ts